VDHLPIAGRRWDAFVLLDALMSPPDGTSGMKSVCGISGLYDTHTRVDGATNNQAFFSEARGRANSGALMSTAWTPIKEYQVSASNYSAELGQARGRRGEMPH